MKSLQGYKILTTFLYRLICNIIIPIIIIIGGIIGYNYFNITAFYLIIGVLMLLEIIEDYWGFCGIFKKGTRKLDFIKTSFKGDSYLKKAFFTDIIIRPIRIFLVLFISSLVYLRQIDSLILIAVGFVVTSFISISLINIVRYIEMFQILMIVASLGTGLGSLLMTLILLSGKYMFILTIALAILTVISGIITYKHMEKKIKDSYYDL